MVKMLASLLEKADTASRMRQSWLVHSFMMQESCSEHTFLEPKRTLHTAESLQVSLWGLDR